MTLAKVTKSTPVALVLLLTSLAICNLGFVKSSSWPRLAWGLFGYGSLWAVYKVADLRPGDIGLSKSKLKSGLKYGLWSAAGITGALLMIFAVSKNAYHDPRYQHDMVKALSASLLILPIQTIFFEELAFRGLLPALIERLTKNFWVVVVASSALFGLWHLATAPTSVTVSAIKPPQALINASIFLVTSLAGAGLYLLRRKSGSLVAPIIAHWSINGVAMILAAIAWRASK